MMHSLGPSATPQHITPKAIFEHADRFMGAYFVLNKANDQTMLMIAAPVMVISAFASELYLKCFRCLENLPLLKGHDLQKQYAGLSLEGRMAIERHWNAIIQDREEILKLVDWQSSRRLPRDLDGALDEGKRAFELIRYIYEGGDDFCFDLIDLPLAIRRALIDIKPDLGQQDGSPIGLSSPHATNEGIRKEGSISFRVRSPNTGWANDANMHDFGSFRAAGIGVRVFKTPDRCISITINGPLGRTFQFNNSIPPLKVPDELRICMKWGPRGIILYFDGEPIVTVDPKLPHPSLPETLHDQK